MPNLSVFMVDTELGDPRSIGTLSYKNDWTYAEARVMLEKMKVVKFEFQFMDLNLSSRMQREWEPGSMLEDCGSRIILIPRVHGPVPDPVTQSPIDLVSTSGGSHVVINIASSNASNAPSVTTTETDSLMPSSAVGDEWGTSQELSPVRDSVKEYEEDTTVPLDARVSTVPLDPRVSLESILMPTELKKQWAVQVDKLKDHMRLRKAEHHKWKARTWDDGTVYIGKITCVECDTRHSGASKGIMTERSIRNVFTNFREKHLLTPKHIQAVAANRGERIDDAEVARRVDASSLDDNAVLEQHVQILERVNSSQSVGQVTFAIVTDVGKPDLVLSKVKLQCTFCNDEMMMIPQQRNLETNLRAHCASLKHISVVSKSQLPASGEPILSGRPGRPRQADKRDKKQRLIAGFFEGRMSGTGSSMQPPASTSDKGKGTLENFSVLCWGLWRDVLQYSGESRPVKEILHDQVKVGGNWYPEPWVRAEVLCDSNGQTCKIDGTFRHKECRRVSELGGGFEGLTCTPCFSIKQERDFRLRVARECSASEKRGCRGTGKGRNLRHLTIPEVQRQSQAYRLGIRREKGKCRRLEHRVCMLQTKVPTLRQVCSEAANQKEVYRFCSSIVSAHRNGSFGGKEALWDLLKDIVLNLNRRKQGHRYSKGSKLICQTLFQHGGRRVVDCLSSNGIGPSLNTLQRDKRGMAVFHPGIHEGQVQFIAQVYLKIKRRLGITGAIPVFFAEDETCVKKTVRWNPKHDTLLGFCGAKDAHVCVAGLELKVGDGDSGFESITNAFEGNVIGHQARCIIVNPLHTGFPRLCILATATCNKFDAGWVREQWKTIDKLWATHCLEAVGPLLGHASDGDSRRRKLMLEDYTGRGIPGPRLNIRWDGWKLTHSFTKGLPVNHAYGLHDQDYIHNGKKLVNPLDSCSRILKLGAEVATLSHLVHVKALYDIETHGMNQEDILRTDRQNWASAQRLCSRKVCRSLGLLRMRQDAKRELSLGTEVYVRICGDYLDIFMNPRLTLRERVVLCGKVGFFFRLWRLWCFHGNHSVGGNQQTIKFGKHCIPMQTFLDIQMSVHFVVLLIIQFRDHFNTLPVPLHLTGSDSCEQFFSKVGGMNGHERSYDLSELVDCATSMNRLAAMDLVAGMQGVGQSHKKHKAIWMKLHPVESEDSIGQGIPIADQTDYTGIANNEDVVGALKEGFSLAQSECTELQMNPSTSCKNKLWWDRPWVVEARGAKSGGWCDVDVTSLGDTPDALPAVDAPSRPIIPEPVSHGSLSQTALAGGDVVVTDGVPDVIVASAGCNEVMTQIFNEMTGEELLYSEKKTDVKPTVSFEGRHMYKSTLVSQLTSNPFQSKDRLTRVKQSLYFNNLVDKPVVREGVRTMMMDVGSDCAVFFEEDPPVLKARETRSAEEIAKSFKGKGRCTGGKNPKKPRGKSCTVSTDPEGRKYVWWVGRVQSIQRKYGSKTGRSRETVDLLDRPSKEAACRVMFNWFRPVGVTRKKFVYILCDPQLIDLDCVISTVSLSISPRDSKVFLLAAEDSAALDDFVKDPHKDKE